ncbi:MAG: YceI family protein [Bacteroidota bacterium]|nr:MAG: YceI family protein [Bacteroidota bacterium]
MKTFANSILLAAFLIGTSAFAQDLKVDLSKSSLKWTGKKIGGAHNGQISLKDGSMKIAENQITSGTFVIDMTTITCTDLTGEWNEKLVGHLNSDDFFSTSNFKTATLVISSATKFSNGVAQVKGKLTIKGMTHPVSFDVKQSGKTYTATVNVDRTLYDIRYGSGKFFDNLGDNTIDDIFTLDVAITTL